MSIEINDKLPKVKKYISIENINDNGLIKKKYKYPPGSYATEKSKLLTRQILDTYIICECGCRIQYGSQYKHYITNKHKKNMKKILNI